MARIVDGLGSGSSSGNTNHEIIAVDGAEIISVPGSEFTGDAQMTREGHDLILEAPNGKIIVIEGYFLAEPAPVIQAADGSALTPQLIESFTKSPMQFAQTGSMVDESPVGAIEEVKGDAVIIRADGTQEPATIGTPVYQGDIVETSKSGAVNIVFLDETSMAISEDARFAVNEYTFDPASESGTTNFSVLRGVFVFTSGLIGRDDPDDVEIETPVGSIGIRGTIIAGNIKPGGETEISVLEGAIVVRNGFGEKTLSTQFEAIKISGFDQPMSDSFVMSANDIGNKFGAVRDVAPTLFSAVNDSAKEPGNNTPQENNKTDPEAQGEQEGEGKAPESGESKNPADINMQDNKEAGNVNQPVDPAAPEGEAPPVPPPTTDPILQTGWETPEFDNSKTNGDGLPSHLPSNDALGTGFEARPAEPIDVKPPQNTEGEETNTDEVLPPPPDTTNNNTVDTTLYINAPNAARGVSVIIDDIGNHIGFDLAALGDLNNDGFADFMFTNNTTNAAQNHSYVVYGAGAGGPSGLVPNLVDNTIAALNDIDADPGEIGVLGNNTSNANFSHTLVAGIGDFDGDGVEDYVITQKNNNSGTAGTGDAAIVSGASGNSSTFVGLTGGDLFGASVAGVGDINNDGYDDVLIGAPGADGAFTDGGKAYLVYGGQNPLGTNISETSLMSATGLTFEGGANNENFGAAVTGLGDFDGDGGRDFAIGAPDGNRVNVHLDSGIIDIHHMTAGYNFGSELSGLGDINGDGLSDMVIASATVQNEAYFVSGGSTSISDIDAATANANVFKINTGPHNILGAGAIGDWNGDGFDDFALAVSSGADANVYVLYGKQNIFANDTIDLSFLNNPQNAFKMVYQGGNALHFTIEGLGDIDSDGFDDLGIGIENFNEPNSTGTVNDGKVIVVEGRDATDSVLEGSNTSANNLTANANNQSIVGGKFNDYVHDGGNSGLSVKGAAGDDVVEITNTNFRSIDGGFGHDTILLGANGLDFGNIEFEKISSVEKLEMTQAGQTVRLTLENIFNLLETAEGHELKIDANGFGGTTLVLDIDGDGTDDVAGNPNTAAELSTAINSVGHASSVNGSPPTGYVQFDIGNNTLYIDANIAVDAQ